MIITIFCDIPEMTTSENAVRSLLKIKPKASEKTSTGQKPFSAGAPERAMVITPMMKDKKGSKVPKMPPWNSIFGNSSLGSSSFNLQDV